MHTTVFRAFNLDAHNSIFRAFNPDAHSFIALLRVLCNVNFSSHKTVSEFVRKKNLITCYMLLSFRSGNT